MPVDALLLVLAAAAVHAFWNIALARVQDTIAATAIAVWAALVVFAPIAAVRWRVEADAWPYIAGSAALELAYMALLAVAYARAEISVVYPVARGLAPVLVLVVAAAAFGADTSWLQATGVCAIGGGVLLVRGRKPSVGRGATFGVVIAACIAGYSLIDNSGVERADPFAYLELVMIAPAVGLTAWVFARDRTRLRAAVRWDAILIGPASFGAFALALLAYQRAPAAPVSAVRETGVLLVTAMAAIALRERLTAVRAAGAVTIVGGIVLLGA